MTVEPTHRRWTNRTVTREVDHHRARWLWGLLLGFVLASAPSAAYLLQQNECLRMSYEVNRLRTEQERLIELQRRLGMRRDMLESLESIEAWAVRRHGLAHPVPGQVIVVRETTPQRSDLVAAIEETERDPTR